MHVQGVEQSVLSVCLSVSLSSIITKITRSEDSGITVVGKYNKIVGSGENCLLSVS